MANVESAPLCLQYAMWALAASSSEKYDGRQSDFYQRARKNAEVDEMKGCGELTTTVRHCQTWILIATYEFKQMYFPSAWISTGRAVRLAQMMQLHKIDENGEENPCPEDWAEREEHRRTFWMGFCIDRYASIVAGWPMVIDERDVSLSVMESLAAVNHGQIYTNLPSSEEAFGSSAPMQTESLVKAMSEGKSANPQPFGGIVLTAALLGRNLLSQDRLSPGDNDHDLDGEFWTHHRAMEATLLDIALGLPDNLRLPPKLTNPNVVFFNMSLHAATICLHQTAIFKADKQRLPATVSSDSKVRCITAAGEIASLMRIISHVDLNLVSTPTQSLDKHILILRR